MYVHAQSQHQFAVAAYRYKLISIYLNYDRQAPAAAVDNLQPNAVRSALLWTADQLGFFSAPATLTYHTAPPAAVWVKQY